MSIWNILWPSKQRREKEKERLVEKIVYFGHPIGIYDTDLETGLFL